MKKAFYISPIFNLTPGATGLWQGNIIEPARKFKIVNVVWDYVLFLLSAPGGVPVQKIPYDQQNWFHAQLNLVSGNPATPITSQWGGPFAAPAVTYNANYRYLSPGEYSLDGIILWNNLLANIEITNFDLVNSVRVNIVTTLFLEYLR